MFSMGSSLISGRNFQTKTRRMRPRARASPYDDQTGGARQQAQAERGYQREDDHAGVAADSQGPAAELVDPAEAEVGGADVHGSHDRGTATPATVVCTRSACALAKIGPSRWARSKAAR